VLVIYFLKLGGDGKQFMPYVLMESPTFWHHLIRSSSQGGG
jgi:hypothetical protein